MTSQSRANVFLMDYQVTYGQFVLACLEYHRSSQGASQRLGQVVYNILSVVRPDVASQVRGTPLDPFYRDFVTDDVWEFIESKW